MKTIAFWLGLLAVFVAGGVLLQGIESKESEGPVVKKLRPLPSLEFRVQAQPRYLQYQRIRLSFILRNVGVTEQPFYRFTYGDALQIYVIKNGEEEPYRYSRSESLRGSKLSLSPGDEYSWSLEVTKSRGQLLLDTPGEYRVYADFKVPDKKTGRLKPIRSNTIRFVVEEPVGDDAKICARLKQLEAFWSYKEKDIPVYEALIARYPRSGYSASMHYQLAGIYHIHAGSNEVADANRIYLKKAIAHYARSTELYSDDMLAGWSTFCSGGIPATLGDIQAAVRYYGEAFRSPSSTVEDQMHILTAYKHLEERGFYRESGIAAPGKKKTTTVFVDLASTARALGYHVFRNPADDALMIERRNVSWTVKPGQSSVTLNGHTYQGLVVKEDDAGNLKASIKVIAMLFGERYGKGMTADLKYIWES